jgi:hypothetical protein
VPWTDTLHHQVDEARTDARAGFQVSVEPLRVAAIHSLTLTSSPTGSRRFAGGSALDPSNALSKASPVASV